MKHLVILNPGSRGHSSERQFSAIHRLLQTAGIAYDTRITATLEDAYAFSRQGNLLGYDVIVAVGGDGTLNRVINGFYDEEGRRLSQAALGVIYTGTSPDFCKSYHLPLKLGEAVRVLAQGRRHFLPVAKLICSEQPGQPRRVTRYFACCANIGLGPALANRANGGIRNFLGDKLGTFTALLSVLSGYRSSTYQARIDGKPVTIERLVNLSVGRTRFIASGIQVAHCLEAVQKNFYMLTVKNLKWRDIPVGLFRIYSGRPFRNNEVFSLDYADYVEIEFNPSHPALELDGDAWGFLPCQISLAPEPMELIGGRK